MRRLLAGVLLASFGAALGLGALEAGVRLLHLVPARFWKPDPLLGTWHVAGKSGWWTQEELEFRVPVRISSQGLRDVEHEESKPDGVFRVLLLGDSYVEALQVPLERAIGRRLEHWLNALAVGRRVEVISVGVSGYGTASELLYYREKGRAWAADLVVLAFYPGNDVRNNSPELEPVLPPVYGEDGSLVRVIGKQHRRRRGLGGRLLGSLRSYEYLRKQIVTRNPTVARFLVDAGLMKKTALRGVPMVDGVPVDYGVYAPTAPPAWERAWSHTEDLVSSLAAEVASDGASFALAVVTARDQVYPDSWRRVLDTYPEMKKKRWDLEEPERRIMDFCARRGLSCLRWSPLFARRRDAGERLHFVYDGHWTAAGHELAAESLARFLIDNGLIGGEHHRPAQPALRQNG